MHLQMAPRGSEAKKMILLGIDYSNSEFLTNSWIEFILPLHDKLFKDDIFILLWWYFILVSIEYLPIYLDVQYTL